MVAKSWTDWGPVHTYPIFLNPHLSFSIQNFHVHTYLYSNRIRPSRYPTGIRIHSCTQNSFGKIGNGACILLFLERTWDRGCHLEYSIHGKELRSILLRHRMKKHPYLASVKIFLSRERIQKCPDTCGRGLRQYMSQWRYPGHQRLFMHGFRSIDFGLRPTPKHPGAEKNL